MAHPQGGSSSTLSLVELEFENVDFCGGSREDEVRLVTHPTYMCVCVWGGGGGGGYKTGVPGENPLEHGRKPTTNSSHV